MAFLVYSIVVISIFKLIVDAIAGNLLATYSILLETILMGLLLAIVIRTSVKMRLAPRETLIEKVRDLKNQLEKE